MPYGTVTPYVTWRDHAGQSREQREILAVRRLDAHRVGPGVCRTDGESLRCHHQRRRLHKSLGAVTVKSGTLNILLTDAANGVVVADAAAVQWTGGGLIWRLDLEKGKARRERLPSACTS